MDKGDVFVIPEHFFGRVWLETRMRAEGNRLIGEGRAWHYDGQGVLTKDTGWEPTGVVVIMSGDDVEPCKRWWEFWK